MIYQNPLLSDHFEQTLELFSNYLNDTIIIMNSVKKSIYQILNITLHPIEVVIQPNLPSVSAHCKKTLDDLKRISSILRGYSKSKNIQRQQQQTRRSRIDYSSYSRQSHSKKSRVSNYSNNSSTANADGFKKPQSVAQKEQISMVTFQIPNQQNNEKQWNQNTRVLKNYRSMRSLNKTVETPTSKKPQINGIQKNEVEMEIGQIFNFNSATFMKENDVNQRKRSKTLQKQTVDKQMKEIIGQTQGKLKQCLSKHEDEMNEIIKRNGQCLQMLKDIHKNLKSKKQKKSKKKEENKKNEQVSKPQSRRYQAMTPSNGNSNKRQQIYAS